MARTHPLRVSIVPHTHWDREWYSPFQTFRLHLVDLLDDFLPLLESDLGYARFLLDGQMAVVDDYLEVRPEEETRLRRLAATGRLGMGPWYTLPDEFLVSGETLVRNLQAGIARAAAFGGAMDVGYLPDMFGHVAQMPQILSQAGFGHAVVWRGVPSAIDKTAFWWSAPDGTTVRAEYLRFGYGVGATIPEDAKALVRRITAIDRELGEAVVDGILFMNGTDHEVPQPWLGRVVAEANAIQDDYRFEVTSLAEHLTRASTEGLPKWTGELRSGARANLLMGVASNRVDVKQAAARAERGLERLAEPLSALYRAPADWPASLLSVAWREMLRNAAHDSICACSADEVVDAVMHRYAEARQIADGLTERALDALAGSLADRGTVLVNPASRPRSGVVEVAIPADATPDGAQVLYSRPGGRTAPRELRAGDLMTYVASIREQRLGRNTFVHAITIDERDDGFDVILKTGPHPETGASIEAGRREVYDLIAQRPDATYRVVLERPPVQRLLVRASAVPGFGWRAWDGTVEATEPVRVEGHRITNGLLDIAIDASDGTFSLNGKAGFGRLVDDGDSGDTYNYNRPEHDVVIDRPDRVEVTVVESGPVRARVRIDRTYRWPERVDDHDRRVGEVETAVETVVEVRAGDDFVKVYTAFDNRSRDHRLRAWFPLSERAESSRAECAFAIVERGRTAEGGPNELGLPTFPSRRFVEAGGLTVAHEGLLEYEVVDDGRSLALTLLRATAMLSRPPMPYRPDPAGPPFVLDGPQMQGRVVVQYALHVGGRDPYAVADDAFLPLIAAPSHGGGSRPASGSSLQVDGAQVSAVQRVGGTLEVRVFNPSDHETRVEMPSRRGWLVDLRGRPLEPFDGGFPLRAWGIATARLDES